MVVMFGQRFTFGDKEEFSGDKMGQIQQYLDSPTYKDETNVPVLCMTLKEGSKKPANLGVLKQIDGDRDVEPRWNCCSAMSNNCLYVYGGEQKFWKNFKEDILKIDLSNLPELPQASLINVRGAHRGQAEAAMVAVSWDSFIDVDGKKVPKQEERLQIFGGGDDQEIHDGFFFHDLVEDEWSIVMDKSVGAKPCARKGHTLTAVENVLFLIGGMAEKEQLLDDCWVFDCTSVRFVGWVRVRIDFKLPALQAHTASTINKHIIISGGTTADEDNTLFCLTAKFKTGTSIDPLDRGPVRVDRKIIKT